ncbi:MAG: hypothetical protein KDA28_02155 [Phycisphaerales bacterium]|nr:hypothetical protein [Phycisphaerales bacterium]
MKTMTLLILACAATIATAQVDPLAGPTVSTPTAAPTIVERGFDGRVLPPAEGPERAALGHLDLTPDVRARIDEVLLSRAVVMDELVLEHLPLLTRLQSVSQASDRRERREVYAEALRVFRPVTERGRVRDEIARELDDSTEFLRLLAEYDEAITSDTSVRGAGTPAAIRIRELGQEISASYQRIIASRVDQLDDFLGAVDLPIEKEEKIRTIIMNHAADNLLKYDKASANTLIRRILAELTPAERSSLLEVVRDRR